MGVIDAGHHALLVLDKFHPSWHGRFGQARPKVLADRGHLGRHGQCGQGVCDVKVPRHHNSKIAVKLRQGRVSGGNGEVTVFTQSVLVIGRRLIAPK